MRRWSGRRREEHDADAADEALVVAFAAAAGRRTGLAERRYPQPQSQRLASLPAVPRHLPAAGRGGIRIVGSAFDRGLAMFLIARPNIQTWDDFKSKTVAALSKGSCGCWYLRDILAQHGVDPDRDVAFRHLGAEYDRKLELLKTGLTSISTAISTLRASNAPWISNIPSARRRGC